MVSIINSQIGGNTPQYPTSEQLDRMAPGGTTSLKRFYYTTVLAYRDDSVGYGGIDYTQAGDSLTPTWSASVTEIVTPHYVTDDHGYVRLTDATRSNGVIQKSTSVDISDNRRLKGYFADVASASNGAIIVIDYGDMDMTFDNDTIYPPSQVELTRVPIADSIKILSNLGYPEDIENLKYLPPSVDGRVFSYFEVGCRYSFVDNDGVTVTGDYFDEGRGLWDLIHDPSDLTFSGTEDFVRNVTIENKVQMVKVGSASDWSWERVHVGCRITSSVPFIDIAGDLGSYNPPSKATAKVVGRDYEYVSRRIGTTSPNVLPDYTSYQLIGRIAFYVKDLAMNNQRSVYTE